MKAPKPLQVWQDQFSVQTGGRGTSDLSSRISELVSTSKIRTGTAHIFLRHTSASLMLCENADTDVRRDLETWMSAQVLDGDPRFVHDAEGPDDMAAHVRTLICGSDLNVPFNRGRLLLWNLAGNLSVGASQRPASAYRRCNGFWNGR